MTKYFFAFLAVALVIVGTGCQNGSIAPVKERSQQQINLNSPTGGLSTSNEAPAFGEADKFSALSNETTVQDSSCSDSSLVNGAKLYEFRAIWGHLADLGDSNAAAPCPLDWSGTLHLEGGIIAMERTIAFEPGDSLYRVDRSTIKWVSHTRPGVDGIQVRLVVPTDTSFCSGCTPVLELSTGPFARTFQLAELSALSLLASVDTCGNGISITSVLAPPACPHGQLMGLWERTASDSTASSDSIGPNGKVLGIFRGIWIARAGLTGGHLRGVFGLNSAGEQVFFGKYIDTQGHFKGILRGTFGSRPALAVRKDKNKDKRHGHGWFAGEWIDGSMGVQGYLKGHWIAGDEGKGILHGVWGMRCSEGTEGDISQGGNVDLGF